METIWCTPTSINAFRGDFGDIAEATPASLIDALNVEDSLSAPLQGNGAIVDAEEPILQERAVVDEISDGEFQKVDASPGMEEAAFDPSNPFNEDDLPNTQPGASGNGEIHECDPIGINGEEVIGCASSDDEASYEALVTKEKRRPFTMLRGASCLHRQSLLSKET